MKPRVLWGRCLLAAWVATCARAPGDEIDDLARLANAPPRHRGHRPQFAAVERSFTFAAEKGEAAARLWVIQDGTRCVAVYHPKASKLYAVAPSPDRAPREVTLPPTYNDGGNTFDGKLGTRVTTFPYAYGFVQTSPHRFTFAGGGETLTLTDTTTWADARQAEATVALTVRCDAVLGYVIDFDVCFRTRNLAHPSHPGRRLTPELINLYPNHTFMRKMPDAAWRYERTVYTPRGTDRYVAWVNDFSQSDLADGLEVRPGGFVAFLADPHGTGPALRRGPVAEGIQLINQTCNLQYDQHFIVTLPERPDAGGYYEVRAADRLVFLPPEVTRYVLDRVEVTDWRGNDAFQVGLGEVEGFEGRRWPVKPLYKKGYRAPRLSDREARSGKRSLHLRRRQRVRVDPRPVLAPKGRYRLSAWVKVEGDGQARIESLPSRWVARGLTLKPERSRSVTSGEGWQHVSLSLTNGPLGMTAWQFLVLEGRGEAFVDDLLFEPLTEGAE